MAYPNSSIGNSDYSSTILLKVKPVGKTSYTNLPTPSTYRMTSSTLVNNSRNADGVAVFSTVREGIRKIEVTWKFLDRTQFSTIAKLFEDSSVGGTGAFVCYLYYFDTIRNAYITSENEHIKGDSSKPLRTFYVGDRVSDTAELVIKNGYIQGYANVKLSLIEC